MLSPCRGLVTRRRTRCQFDRSVGRHRRNRTRSRLHPMGHGPSAECTNLYAKKTYDKNRPRSRMVGRRHEPCHWPLRVSGHAEFI